METGNIKLETVAMWLNDQPGRSCGAQFIGGQFDVRLVQGGLEYHGSGRTLEQAFADAWRVVQSAGSRLTFRSIGGGL